MTYTTCLTTINLHYLQAAVWAERYLVVQGRRVAWWSSVKQLEAGRSAECLLLLQGHAGVSGASPLELRDAEVHKCH
jgi:hypothetical protein